MQYINFRVFFFIHRLTPTYRFRIVLQNSMNGPSLYRRWSASGGHSHRGSNRGDLPRVLLFFLFLRHRPKYAITRHERSFFFFFLSSTVDSLARGTIALEEIKGSYDKTCANGSNDSAPCTTTLDSLLFFSFLLSFLARVYTVCV